MAYVSLGMVIIPRILVISHKKRLYDVPDSRKVHTTPVPRLGGLSFFPVILMSMFLVIGFRLYFWDMDSSSLSFNMLYEYLFLFVGMTLLYLVGVCDDLVGVGYRYKFAVQIVSAVSHISRVPRTAFCGRAITVAPARTSSGSASWSRCQIASEMRSRMRPTEGEAARSFASASLISATV